METRALSALKTIPNGIGRLPRVEVPLLPYGLVGIDALRSMGSGALRASPPAPGKAPDPAAHVEHALRDRPPTLSVTRIDPGIETRRYTEEVLATTGKGLDAQGRALLEEDLRSPCAEEIAVFRAFAETVARGEDGFVIIDTAPTGHTLLLLDAAEA